MIHPGSRVQVRPDAKREELRLRGRVGILTDYPNGKWARVRLDEKLGATLVILVYPESLVQLPSDHGLVGDEGIVGSVIAVGTTKGYWMFVTRLEANTVHGRVWSTQKRRWAMSVTTYGRDAMYRRKPIVPKPEPPKDSL